MLKKIFLSLLVSLFLLTNIVTPAKADTWFNQSPINWYKKVYDTSISPEPEIFGERYTAAQVQWIFYTILGFPLTILGSEITNCVFSPDLTCMGVLFGGLTSELKKHPELATNNGKSLSQFLFEDRPLSGITYVKGQFQRLEIIPTANAQQAGFGFSALNPIITMWQQMRNISYIFLILATITLAFMIMFRIKVSPQIVITAQSALPKIITGMILVTFSYAIAGFLVDLMYVVIGLVSLAFGWQFSHLTTFPLIGSFIVYVLLFMLTAMVVLIATLGAVMTSIGVGLAVIAVLTPGLNVFLGLIMLLIIFLVFILVIIHFLRTFFMLTKAFANILLLTIFAPLQIMLGTVVESMGFNTWLRSFVSNLSVFVVTGILLNLSIWFLAQAMLSSLRAFVDEDLLHTIFNFLVGTHIVNIFTQESAGWPPLLSMGTDQGVAFLMLGASFVTFTLIPKTNEIIQGVISGRPFAFGSAIGEYVQGTQKTISGGIETIGTISRAERTRQQTGGGRTTPPQARAPEGPTPPGNETIEGDWRFVDEE